MIDKDLIEALTNLLDELKRAEFRAMSLVDNPPADMEKDFTARMIGEHTAYRQAAWRLAAIIERYRDNESTH